MLYRRGLKIVMSSPALCLLACFQPVGVRGLCLFVKVQAFHLRPGTVPGFFRFRPCRAFGFPPALTSARFRVFALRPRWPYSRLRLPGLSFLVLLCPGLTPRPHTCAVSWSTMVFSGIRWYSLPRTCPASGPVIQSPAGLLWVFPSGNCSIADG